MRVRLLGTGSADRWPNPWCACASCDWARATGALRDRTSAMVDDVLLIDPGPDAGARGADLSRVRTVLITHDHPDHLDPAFLLAWEWAAAAAHSARPSEPGPPDQVGRSYDASDPTRSAGNPIRPALVVAGPAEAVRRCEQWISPHAPVGLRTLAAGEVLTTETHEVRALPAAHSTSGGLVYDGTALLYDIASRDARLLYATDTGSLPHDDLTGAYDLVLLEQTFGDLVDHGTAHLDMPSFGREVAVLRAADRVAPGGRVVAVHLSHHNGPDLADRLAEVQAEALPDGTTVSVGEAAATHEGADRGPRSLLVTGGARSGKSHHAESVAAATGRPVVYVATAGTYPDDPEWAARIAAHRQRRPASWQTIETTDVAGLLRSADTGACVLVDCLTLWLTAVLDEAGWDDVDAAQDAATAAIIDLTHALASCRSEVVLVTNEVGSGVVPGQASGRLFRDLLGRTNVAIAAECADVTLVTAGIPVALKGAPWPITT